MPETPYPENEHDRLPQSGHSADWHRGFSDYWDKVASGTSVSMEYWAGYCAAQAEDEAVDGSDKDIGA